MRPPRLIPLHQSTIAALGSYAACRDRLCSEPSTKAFFVSVDAAGTYWYLSASPELMELAAARLERRFGPRP